MMRAFLFVVLASLVAPFAGADEPLWTDGKAAVAPAMTLQSFVKLSRALGPAVVNVVALQSGEDHGDSEHPRPRGKGQGTGFVIHKSGYILTNAHVVDGADDVRVRLVDERELTARVVGKDERTDIALLKIEAGGDLAVAPLGNSDDVQIGEWVMAIGNPFGLDHTVTVGIISAKGRRDVHPSQQSGYYDFIQTDASINPGNSGGPLIDSRGHVIGINTAMNTQGQGIGFAIPINMAKVIAPLLRSFGRAPRSWLGVYPQALSQTLRKAFAITESRGALIADVVADSPAARAGVETGDVVLDYDGHPIKRADDLMWLVATTPAGKRVTLNLLHGGKPRKIEAVVQAAPDESPAQPPAARGNSHRSPLGMTVSEISPSIAQELGNPTLRGVVVMSVEPDSPAVEAGVERGDLVLRVGDVNVAALEDYARAVRAIKHGDMIRMLIKRDGKNQWVAFAKR